MGLQDTTNITKSRDKERFPTFYISMAASLNKKVFIGQIFNINPRVQDESSIFLLISFKLQTLKHQYLQNLCYCISTRHGARLEKTKILDLLGLYGVMMGPSRQRLIRDTHCNENIYSLRTQSLLT